MVPTIRAQRLSGRYDAQSVDWARGRGTVGRQLSGNVILRIRRVFATSFKGDPERPHSSREMPEWREVFRTFSPDDNVTKLRVRNLVKYLGSIQITSS